MVKSNPKSPQKQLPPQKPQPQPPPHRAALQTASTLTPNHVASFKYGADMPPHIRLGNGNMNISKSADFGNVTSTNMVQNNYSMSYSNDTQPTMDLPKFNGYARSVPATQFYRKNSKNKMDPDAKPERQDLRTEKSLSDPSHFMDLNLSVDANAPEIVSLSSMVGPDSPSLNSKRDKKKVCIHTKKCLYCIPCLLGK